MTTKIDKIAQDVQLLKERLLEQRPDRFSARDIARSFFGALFIAATFVFTSKIFDIVKQMQQYQLIVLITATIIILVAEIYFIGWSRLKKLREPGRNVFELTIKRVIVAYAVSIAVAVFYLYVLGFSRALSSHEMVNFIFLVAMPCSIGAAVADLLRKY